MRRRPPRSTLFPYTTLAEGGDALPLREELAQAVVKRRGGLARDRVVVSDGAALLHDLARGVEADDPREAGAVEPPLCGGDFLFERAHGGAPYDSPTV